MRYWQTLTYRYWCNEGNYLHQRNRKHWMDEKFTKNCRLTYNMVQTRYHWSRCCKKVILKKHLHELCSLSCIAKLLSSWLRIKVKDLRSVYTNDVPNIHINHSEYMWIWRDMVYFKGFEGCLPQILLGAILNTSSHMTLCFLLF